MNAFRGDQIPFSPIVDQSERSATDFADKLYQALEIANPNLYTKLISGEAAVLDLGGGMGKFEMELRKSGVANVASLDVVDRGSEVPGKIIGDVHAMPVENESKDLVTSFGLLDKAMYRESGIDVDKILDEIYRVLKNNGSYFTIDFSYFFDPIDLNNFLEKQKSRFSIKNVGLSWVLTKI